MTILVMMKMVTVITMASVKVMRVTDVLTTTAARQRLRIMTVKTT